MKWPPGAQAREASRRERAQGRKQGTGERCQWWCRGRRTVQRRNFQPRFSFLGGLFLGAAPTCSLDWGRDRRAQAGSFGPFFERGTSLRLHRIPLLWRKIHKHPDPEQAANPTHNQIGALACPPKQRRLRRFEQLGVSESIKCDWKLVRKMLGDFYFFQWFF